MIIPDYVIVLGTSDKQSLRKRTERAVNLVQEMESKLMLEYSYDRNTLGNDSAALMIFSGRSPEAENMAENAKELLRDDFPVDNLVIENTSFNTWQNIVNSQKILDQYRLCPGDVLNVFVVSSAFHIPRVNIICSALFDTFFKVTCVPTNEPITEFRKNREISFISTLKNHLDQNKISVR
jgi:uncharacterized SAM-binding protein YcdF (DUF218 family)